MKKIFFSTCLLAVAFLFFSLKGNCQKIFYSESEHTGTSNYRIIGQVKNNIIVCKYDYAYKNNSEILIYDVDMHIIKRVKNKILKPESLQVDFSNNRDSFQMIFQYKARHNLICKQAVFDENGNCLSVKKIFNFQLDANVNASNAYRFFRSTDNKSFALVNATGNDSLNILYINYIFVLRGLNYSGCKAIPFNVKTSDIENIMLDNENLVFSTTNKTDSSCVLSVFKINLKTDSIINTLRQIQDGFLVDNSIIIKSLFNTYLVSGEWKDNKKQTGGIFLWKLNNDLSDAVTDTIITKNNDSTSAIYDLKNFTVNVFQGNKNALNLFVFSNNGTRSISENLFSKSGSINYSNNVSYYNRAASSGGTFYSSNPYTGVVHTGNTYNDGLDDFISNSAATENSYGYSSDSLVNHNNYTDTQNLKLQDPKLTLLKMSVENKILNTQTFNSSIDKDAVSYVNDAAVLNTSHAMFVIFNQTTTDGKQTFGYIKIQKENFEYTYNPLVLMKLNYKFSLEQSLQISNNTLILPCKSDYKTAFAKIVFY